MSPPKKPDYSVGYGKPPTEHRWKKGQTGNPRGKRKRADESTVAIFDRLLMSEIEITENGNRRKATKLEGIVLQLCAKERAGHNGALKIRLQFEELATQPRERRVEVVFVDNEYTRAVANRAPTEESDDD